ncbi:MAG: fructose-bisphosphate aldolase, class [Streptomycetaceae bacterium]|jgi:fructose-bisphosphate aldolase class II|nr:fructose-bisphosphate aldolase, class [Streptomycetaceae bacterium]
MPLTGTGHTVTAAVAARHGAAAFNIIQLEHTQAVIAGAEAANAPVILQISENAVRYHGALAPLARAALSASEAARVPVSVHLDHATGLPLVREAIALGLSSVMFDASTLGYNDNVKVTAEVVRLCHDSGVWVEAELGEVGGKDGVHAPGARTDPAEAAAYVAATGVDALAVAVGTSHAMLTRDAALDFGLIRTLRRGVPVPLVLHGSSGVSDAGLAEAVAHGMTKINIATHLNSAFTAAVRDHLAAHPATVDPRAYLGAGRAAVTAEVTRLLGILRPGHTPVTGTAGPSA